MDRLSDLVRFYGLLGKLQQAVGGRRLLANCDGRMSWPGRGVYFFFEAGESRLDSGDGPRVVRVGTHALTATSRTTLWGRLAKHRGVEKTGGGNHRTSVFRDLVGSALKHRFGVDGPHSWGVGGDFRKAAARLAVDPDNIRKSEGGMEIAVSEFIRAMPFLWLAVEDAPGPESLRGLIERNSIALLSNFEKPPLDPASGGWLGRSSDRERVRRSGLWNNNHVDEAYDPRFLDALEGLIDAEI